MTTSNNHVERKVKKEHDADCECLECQEHDDHYGSGYNGEQ